MFFTRTLLLTTFAAFAMGAVLQRDDVGSGELIANPVFFDEDGQTIGARSATEYDKRETWEESVVRQHNEYRAQYGAPPFTWSAALYPDTLEWAKRCNFVHSGGSYGENLAAGYGGNYGFPRGLSGWMNEASKYDYDNPGFSKATGHFTQVVWKGSKQVACAMVDCPAGTVFASASKNIVCRYTPAGNIRGKYPENVGRHI